MLRRLSTEQEDFDEVLERLLAYEAAISDEVQQRVRQILREVRLRKDAALLDYTARFDAMTLNAPEDLEIPAFRWQEALAHLPPALRNALENAAARIRLYAEQQKIAPFHFTDAFGNHLGQRITPLERVGIYVPGGKAAYPSSVLMNAIPARVAGVGEIIMTVPTPKGEVSPLVLAAAAVAEVDRVFTLGGAQAIAALAYGTAVIPKVDKIVGPGNAYVAEAKRQVFGQVGIDMVAGPSEILIVADAGISVDWLVADLFSQAEHDEQAQAILLSPDKNLLDQVAQAIDRQLENYSRQDIIRQSLQNRGALIQVRDFAEACRLVNRIAPEHLELAVAEPEHLLPMLRHAGAIFMGYYTPEAFGDYCAGPNHVLPTSGTARFSSPLGVYDFQKRSSVITCSVAGAKHLSQVAGILADGEALTAHARSARFRG
jgi:histidinol dehydrogenase